MLRDLKYFFLISRPFNLLIAWVSFAVACFIAQYQRLAFLEDGKFWATSLTIVGIAAAGYWINDVYDFRIDRINKPGRTVVNAILSVKKVMTVYFVFNGLILLSSAAYLTYYHHQLAISFINVLSVMLLFVYASYLKRVSVAGNLVIAFLIALVIILAGYLYGWNVPLAWTIIFAFQITFIREVTKDVEDMPGDLRYNLHTLPIQVGIRRTKWILLFLYLTFLVTCYLPFFLKYFRTGEYLYSYLLLSVLLVQAPVLYLISLLKKAFRPRDFTAQSRYLKYLMLTGILTLLFLH